MPVVHGITLQERVEGPGRIETSPTHIALVGTAPKLINTPGSGDDIVLCSNRSDDAAFGKPIDGYTIPQTLEAIRANHPSAKVMVLNVTRAAHFVANPTTTFTAVSLSVAAGASQLASGGVNKYQKAGTTPVLTNLAGNVTYTAGVHYSINAAGAITVIDAIAIPDGVNIRGTWISHTSYEVTGMKVTLPYAPKTGTLVLKNNIGTVTYVSGTDYTVDDWGKITIILGGAIVETNVVSPQYDRFDGALVTAAHVNGAAAPGNNTGWAKIGADSLIEFNYTPNILISPVYNEDTDVAGTMETISDLFKAQYILDGDTGDTPAQAVTARGALSLKNFNTVNPRVICVYPKLYMKHGNGGANYLWGMSAFLAGIMSLKDATSGYWFSPSGTQIKGHSGAERLISWTPSGTGSDAATLNDAGIVTLKQFNGLSVWGNCNASFPSVTDGTQFIGNRRTYDTVALACQMAAVEYLGKNLNSALIDEIKQRINAFLNAEIQNGALGIGSSCTYDPSKNPAQNLAAGILVLDIAFIANSPLQNLVLNFTIDLNLLAS